MPTTFPEVCARTNLKQLNMEDTSIRINGLINGAADDVRNIFQKEHKWTSNKRILGFILEFLPRNHRRVIIEQLQIEVDPKCIVLIALGNTNSSMTKQAYRKYGSGIITFQINRTRQFGESFKFLRLTVESSDTSKSITVKNLKILVCYEIGDTTDYPLVTYVCSEGATFKVGCIKKTCENGMWVVRRVCLLKCSTEFQKLVEYEDKCCQCIDRTGLSTTYRVVTSKTTTFCKKPLIHTLCLQDKCLTTCQAQQRDKCGKTRRCLPGCECPSNLFFNGIDCVPRKKCHCIDDTGYLKKNGDTWLLNCTKFVCNGYRIKQLVSDCAPVDTRCPLDNRIMVNCCMVCNIPIVSTTTATVCVYDDQVLKIGDFISRKRKNCVTQKCVCMSSGNLGCTEDESNKNHCKAKCSRLKCKGRIVERKGKCQCTCACHPSSHVPMTPCSSHNYKCELPCNIAGTEKLTLAQFQDFCDTTEVFCGQCLKGEVQFIDPRSLVVYCLQLCCQYQNQTLKIGQLVPQIRSDHSVVPCSYCQCTSSGTLDCFTNISCSMPTITTTHKVCSRSCVPILEESMLSTCRKRICNYLNDKCFKTNLCNGSICECKEPLVFNGTTCVNTNECLCKDDISQRIISVGQSWIDVIDPCRLHLCTGNKIETKNQRKECPVLECPNGCLNKVVESVDKCCPICFCYSTTNSPSPQTTSISSITSSVLKRCFISFCEIWSCSGQCINGEGRKEKCDRLHCGKIHEAKRNETHVYCAFNFDENCGTTSEVVPPSSMTIQTSSMSTSQLFTKSNATIQLISTFNPSLPMTTEGKFCFFYFCDTYTCLRKCLGAEGKHELCRNLNCEGLIEIKVQESYTVCTKVVEENCSQSTVNVPEKTNVTTVQTPQSTIQTKCFYNFCEMLSCNGDCSDGEGRYGKCGDFLCRDRVEVKVNLTYTICARQIEKNCRNETSKSYQSATFSTVTIPVTVTSVALNKSSTSGSSTLTTSSLDTSKPTTTNRTISATSSNYSKNITTTSLNTVKLPPLTRNETTETETSSRTSQKSSKPIVTTELITSTRQSSTVASITTHSYKLTSESSKISTKSEEKSSTLTLKQFTGASKDVSTTLHTISSTTPFKSSSSSDIVTSTLKHPVISTTGMSEKCFYYFCDAYKCQTGCLNEERRVDVCGRDLCVDLWKIKIRLNSTHTICAKEEEKNCLNTTSIERVVSSKETTSHTAWIIASTPVSSKMINASQSTSTAQLLPNSSTPLRSPSTTYTNSELNKTNSITQATSKKSSPIEKISTKRSFPTTTSIPSTLSSIMTSSFLAANSTRTSEGSTSSASSRPVTSNSSRNISTVTQPFSNIQTERMSNPTMTPSILVTVTGSSSMPSTTSTVNSATTTPTTVSTPLLLTTIVPCKVVDGLTSAYYIANHQISINDRTNILLRRLETLEENDTMKIDFRYYDTRSSSFITQIIVGHTIGSIELITIDSSSTTKKRVFKFDSDPRVIEINEYLNETKIKILQTLSRNGSRVSDFQIMGCFKEIHGCISEGKHYENNQATISSNQCSNTLCYCEDQKENCRITSNSNECAEKQTLLCSQLTSNATCCSCVPTVTEALCKVDYLCNPRCKICIEGVDSWNKEVMVTNSSECVCKHGYQSFVQANEETVNGKTIWVFSVKCMTSNNGKVSCGTDSKEKGTTETSLSITTMSCITPQECTVNLNCSDTIKFETNQLTLSQQYFSSMEQMQKCLSYERCACAPGLEPLNKGVRACVNKIYCSTTTKITSAPCVLKCVIEVNCQDYERMMRETFAVNDIRPLDKHGCLDLMMNKTSNLCKECPVGSNANSHGICFKPPTLCYATTNKVCTENVTKTCLREEKCEEKCFPNENPTQTTSESDLCSFQIRNCPCPPGYLKDEKKRLCVKPNNCLCPCQCKINGTITNIDVGGLCPMSNCQICTCKVADNNVGNNTWGDCITRSDCSSTIRIMLATTSIKTCSEKCFCKFDCDSKSTNCPGIPECLNCKCPDGSYVDKGRCITSFTSCTTQLTKSSTSTGSTPFRRGSEPWFKSTTNNVIVRTFGPSMPFFKSTTNNIVVRTFPPTEPMFKSTTNKLIVRTFPSTRPLFYTTTRSIFVPTFAQSKPMFQTTENKMFKKSTFPYFQSTKNGPIRIDTTTSLWGFTSVKYPMSSAVPRVPYTSSINPTTTLYSKGTNITPKHTLLLSYLVSASGKVSTTPHLTDLRSIYTTLNPLLKTSGSNTPSTTILITSSIHPIRTKLQSTSSSSFYKTVYKTASDSPTTSEIYQPRSTTVTRIPTTDLNKTETTTTTNLTTILATQTLYPKTSHTQTNATKAQSNVVGNRTQTFTTVSTMPVKTSPTTIEISSARFTPMNASSMSTVSAVTKSTAMHVISKESSTSTVRTLMKSSATRLSTNGTTKNVPQTISPSISSQSTSTTTTKFITAGLSTTLTQSTKASSINSIISTDKSNNVTSIPTVTRVYTSTTASTHHVESNIQTGVLLSTTSIAPSTIETQGPPEETLKPRNCWSILCSQYTCKMECLLIKEKQEYCDQLSCNNSREVQKNATHIICTKIIENNCTATNPVTTMSKIATQYGKSETSSKQEPSTSVIHRSYAPSTSILNFTSKSPTTMAPCNFVDGTSSRGYISDHQISILRNNSSGKVRNLKRSGSGGLDVIVMVETTIEIDLVDGGRREAPLIHQILIGPTEAIIEVTPIDGHGNTKSQILTNSTKPGIIEIDEELVAFKIRVARNLKNESFTNINLKIIGCFIEMGECLVDGRKYINYESINYTSSNNCITNVCYCENQKVQCQSSGEDVNCQKNEMKMCSKSNAGQQCCSCVSQVKEAICKIDYLCNSKCASCKDEWESRLHEGLIKNLTNCVCDNKFQSFFKFIKGNETENDRINVKCMMDIRENLDCEDKRTILTTPRVTEMVSSSNSSTNVTKSVVKSESTRKISNSLSSTKSTPPLVFTTFLKATTTTPTSIGIPSTVPSTHLETTQSTSQTLSQAITTSIPRASTTTTKLCYLYFCQSVTCTGQCLEGEGRRERCDNLKCRGSIVASRNRTHIYCALTVENNCVPTQQVTVATSSSLGSISTTNTRIMTQPPMCVLVTCTIYTCTDECEGQEEVDTPCDSLRCEFGKITIRRNRLYLWCSSSLDTHCLTTPSYNSLTTTGHTSTPAVNECNPSIVLNTEKYISHATSSSNQDSLTLEHFSSTTTDTVPQFEFKFRNTMRLQKIEVFMISNVKRMRILTSNDGKYYETSHYYQGQFKTIERYLKFDFVNTFVLGIKFVVFEKYQNSLEVDITVRVLGCEKTCQLPLVHVQCVCQHTCDTWSNQNHSASCQTTCYPGCQCPNGTVNHNGKCIPINQCPCFYQGRPYSFGDKILTDDPCRTLVCSKDSLQEVATSNCSRQCPQTMEPCPCDGCQRTCERLNILENCDLNACKSGCCCPKGTVYSEILGRCVSNCPCIFGNKTYNVGETWTNRCLNCTCDPEKGAVCKEDGCNFDTCPYRQKIVNAYPDDNICCTCVHIDPVCTFNMREYEIGEIWNDGPCQTYKCNLENGLTMVTSELVTCKSLNCSNGEQIIQPGGKCCPECIQRNYTTTKRVQTTTTQVIPTEPVDQSCHVVYEPKLLKVNDCTSMSPFQFGACEGLCFGKSSWRDPDTNTIISKECTCCQPITRFESVKFKCSDGIKVLQAMNIHSCHCNKC